MPGERASRLRPRGCFHWRGWQPDDQVRAIPLQLVTAHPLGHTAGPGGVLGAVTTPPDDGEDLYRGAPAQHSAALPASLGEGVTDYDDDLVDPIAAVIAEELTQQLHVRRDIRQIPELVAIELLRNFRIERPSETAELSRPDWPILAYVRVDNGDQAHLELAQRGRSTPGDGVVVELPNGG